MGGMILPGLLVLLLGAWPYLDKSSVNSDRRLVRRRNAGKQNLVFLPLWSASWFSPSSGRSARPVLGISTGPGQRGPKFQGGSEGTAGHRLKNEIGRWNLLGRRWCMLPRHRVLSSGAFGPDWRKYPSRISRIWFARRIGARRGRTGSGWPSSRSGHRDLSRADRCTTCHQARRLEGFRECTGALPHASIEILQIIPSRQYGCTVATAARAMQPTETARTPRS